VRSSLPLYGINVVDFLMKSIDVVIWNATNRQVRDMGRARTSLSALSGLAMRGRASTRTILRRSVTLRQKSTP